MNQQKLRVLFFGTPYFSSVTLRALLQDHRYSIIGVVTQPDKPAGRGQSIQASPVKLLAIENQIAVFQPNKIRGSESEFLEEISKLGEVDFGVVVAFGQILPQSILDYPKFGCINVHASLLPRWRGAAPIQRALLAGDSKTGVCIMKMEAGLDTGPVYSSSEIEITDLDSASSLHDRLSDIGGELLVKTLPLIANGLTPTIQAEDGVTYADKIRPSDLLINWEESSQNISLKIRTFSPKPGAYCFLNSKRLKILKVKKAENVRASSPDISAGYILKNSEQGIVIKTGDGFIVVLELQLEGKKAMPVSEFLKGYPGLEGEVLGGTQASASDLKTTV